MSAAAPPSLLDQGDYFENHRRARKFPWTLYHGPIERDLERFLQQVSVEHPLGEVLVVGCGLLHEIDAAPSGLRFHVCDIDERAVAAVLERNDPRITGGTVVEPERAIEIGRPFAGIYAKEVVEHVLAWPTWLVGLRRALVPSGRLWLSTPNYGEPWLPAIEYTVLEMVARRDGFSRRHLHPTKFSKKTFARGLAAAGFESVDVRVSAPARLALMGWARAPR